MRRSRTSLGEVMVGQIQLTVQLAVSSQRTASQSRWSLIKGSWHYSGRSWWCILHHSLATSFQTDIVGPESINRVSQGAEAWLPSLPGLGNQGECKKVSWRHGTFKNIPWHIYIYKQVIHLLFYKTLHLFIVVFSFVFIVFILFILLCYVYYLKFLFFYLLYE